MENSIKTTLSVREAAKILGCSLPVMYDVTERADFDALIRLGRRKIILTHKFFDWLNRQTLKGVS